MSGETVDDREVSIVELVGAESTESAPAKALSVLFHECPALAVTFSSLFAY